MKENKTKMKSQHDAGEQDKEEEQHDEGEQDQEERPILPTQIMHTWLSLVAGGGRVCGTGWL